MNVDNVEPPTHNLLYLFSGMVFMIKASVTDNNTTDVSRNVFFLLI